MVNDQLVALIREKFQKGERADEIKASLVDQGWDMADVDLAISQIQHEALKQMPGISHIISNFEYWEKKTANASPRMIAIVLAGCVALVMVISLFLYISLDPLGTKSAARDIQRETDFIKVNNAVTSYFRAKGMYPTNLNALLPTYLQSVPLDPKTGAPYSYKTIGGTANYELCVSFETKGGQCVSAAPATENAIPEVIDNSNSTQDVAPSIAVPNDSPVQNPPITASPMPAKASKSL